MTHPVSITLDTFGTGKFSDDKLTKIVTTEFDLSPAGIIESLDLRRPIYADTAVYGHFGRPDKDFSWENLDKVPDLKKHLSKARKGGK
jgi:S-adenosylmethionine synthetase